MKQKGFTLIELLVSMGIIAVLTGMAVFNFNQSRIRARDVQRKSDLGQLVKAMELYKIDNGRYPEEDLFQTTLLVDGYTKVTFNDPRGSEWETYDYRTTDQKTYYLMACLENKADATRADETQCTVFGDPECKCGYESAGVMYVVSNP